MRLSRTIAYAVHATLHLARATPGVPIPCSQLAREGSLPERFLLQILRKLVKCGLLESACGVAGGYFLARSPRQISLLDIVEAFDSSLDISLPTLECMSPAVRTQILQTLHAVSQTARAEMQKLTVEDLVRIDAPVIPLNNGELIPVQAVVSRQSPLILLVGALQATCVLFAEGVAAMA